MMETILLVALVCATSFHLILSIRHDKQQKQRILFLEMILQDIAEGVAEIRINQDGDIQIRRTAIGE